MADITVCIPTIDERVAMLGEVLTSVYEQTHQPETVLVRADVQRDGVQLNAQALLDAVQTEWVLFTSDDDLLDPDHLLTLVAARDDFDVVYSYCRSVGNYTFTAYNQPFDPVRLRRQSIVSHTALFRRDWAVKVGGFPRQFGEDWLLWRAMSEAGARFRSVPRVTWTYRFHGRNLSKGELG